MVADCKPEWNREAITVFSRLPSLRKLQVTPLLQTFLLHTLYLGLRIEDISHRSISQVKSKLSLEILVT